MRIIALLLSVALPQLATASFYENCLLIGAVKSLKKNSNNSIKLIFVATHSYTLANSQRTCQYWHDREIDVSSHINNQSKINSGATIALHYTHQSSLCEGGKDCGSTQYKLATYQ